MSERAPLPSRSDRVGQADWLPGQGTLNAGTCDWGDCDEPSVAATTTGEQWLPICRTHISAARAEGYYVLIVGTGDDL